MIPAPKIPKVEIKTTPKTILIQAEKIVLFLTYFSLPVIINMYPTDPADKLINCPQRTIINILLMLKYSGPNNSKILSFSIKKLIKIKIEIIPNIFTLFSEYFLKFLEGSWTG